MSDKTKKRKIVGHNTTRKIDTIDRTPTISELAKELRYTIGLTLVQLRESDPYKTATALSNLARALGTVSTLERLDQYESALGLENLSTEELKKQIDKLIGIAA